MLLITQASSSASPCKKSIVVGRKAPNACAAWPRQFDGLGLPKPSSAVVSYFVRQAGLTLAFARSTASRLCRSTSYLQHSRTGMNKRPIRRRTRLRHDAMSTQGRQCGVTGTKVYAVNHRTVPLTPMCERD